ncbi:MAG: peptidoglycan DD-metalloendopeptidase family protein [Acidimicrobiales bacterium]
MDLVLPGRRLTTLVGAALLLSGLGMAPQSADAADAPPPAPSETRDYMDVFDLTFPVDPAKVRYSDTYDAPRTGHVHQATDIMGPKLLPIYAAMGGTVVKMPMADDATGYRLRIEADDGRTYSYLHLNNDSPGTDDGLGTSEQAYAAGVTLGGRVERGQHIGYMGDSGNAEATAPHLHFNIADPLVTDPYGKNAPNPYPSLKAAESKPDVPTAAAAPPPDSAPPPPLPPAPDTAAVCPERGNEYSFSDVGDANVHLNTVECLVGLEVTEGVGGGRYAPADHVTRLQMASFTARLLRAGGVTLPTDPPDAFDDDDGTVHELAVNQLAELGVIRGDTGEVGRDLQGRVAMKRDRMAAWMVRAYALITGEELPAAEADYFRDDVPGYHEADINRLAETGVVQGTAPGIYSPRDGVRRDQMASYLARTLASSTS